MPNRSTKQYLAVLTLFAASVAGLVPEQVTAAENGRAESASPFPTRPREIRIEPQRFPQASVFTVVGATVEQVVSPQAGTVEIHFDANNHEPSEPKTVLDMGPRGLDRIVVRRLSPRPVIASEASRAFAEASSNRRLEHRFAGQQGRVTSVAISPNGDTGCSASRDGTVRFWSVNSGREVGRLDLVPEQVSQLCFSPDGNHIALSILPQTVVVRDVATGNEVRRFSLQRDAAAVAFSASKDRFWLLSGSPGGRFDLWDVATGVQLRSFQQPLDAVLNVYLSRDGSRASAVGTGLILGTQPTRLLRVWDTRSGKVLQQCSALGVLTVTGTGRHLLMEHDGGERLSLSDVDYRSLSYYYPALESGVALAESSPDGRHILVASHRGRTYLLDAESGQWRNGPGGGGGEITCAAFSPDGALVLLGRADTAELWRVPRFPDAPAAAGDEVHRFVHGGFVYAARFAPDGQRVLTGGCDRALRLWDVSRGTEISKCQGNKSWDVVHDLAWSPDGATVTLALHSLSGGSTLRPWSQPDSLVKRAWTSPLAISFLATNAERISVAPNGKTFFSGGLNGECRELHEQSGYGHYNPSLRPTHSMAFSPDGRRAVSAAGLEDGAVRVWNCRERASWNAPDFVLLLAHEEVRSAVFHPQDSERVLSGGLDGTLRWWDLSGRHLVRQLHISVPVTALAILPDGRRVLTGSESGALQVWDTETGRELASLAGHRDAITTLDVSRDGRFALSGSYDFTARFWKLPLPLSGTASEEDGRQGLPPSAPEPAPREELNIVSEGVRVIVRDSDARVTIKTGDIIIADAMTGWSVRLDPRVLAAIPRRDGGQSGRSDAEAVANADHNIIAEIRHERSVPAVAPAPVAPQPAPIPVQYIREFVASEKEAQGTVGDLDFSADGKLAVSAHFDGRIRVWEVSTGKLICRFDEHRAVIGQGPRKAGVIGIVNAAKFSPNGHFVASAGQDEKLLLWEADTGRLVRQFNNRSEVLRLAFTPQGDQILGVDGASRVCLWEVSCGEELRRQEHPVRRMLHLAIAPDGRRALLTGSRFRPSEPISSLLRVWNLESDEVVFELEYPPRHVIETAAFSADGWTVLAEDPTDRFRLARWDLATGMQVGGYALPAPAQRLTMSHTGTRVLIGSTDARLLDLQTGVLSASLRGGFRGAFSPDDRSVLTAESGRITFWSLPTSDP